MYYLNSVLDPKDTRTDINVPKNNNAPDPIPLLKSNPPTQNRVAMDNIEKINHNTHLIVFIDVYTRNLSDLSLTLWNNFLDFFPCQTIHMGDVAIAS